MTEDAPVLARLSDLLTRRRWLVLVAWGAILLAAAPFAARQSERLTGGGQSVPGSDSYRVDQASSQFAGQRSNQMAVVVHGPRTAAQRRAALRRIEAVVAKTGDAALLPRSAAERAGQRDGGPMVFPLRTPAKFSDGMDVAADLRKNLGVGERDSSGARFYLVGSPPLWAGLSDVSKEDLIEAEVVGFPIVLLILLAVFGSLAAAALPLGLGMMSVTITGAVIWLLSQSFEMSVFVTNMASLLGIGVAVDYSLFILARYRQARAGGADPGAARAVALRTSGAAVVFSGLTVIVALSGLFLINSALLRSMAVGGIVVVAVSVLVAVTLLPVLLTLLGERVERPGRFASRLRRPFAVRAARPGRADGWARWTERVMRRPVRSAVLSALVMLAVASPVLWLETGTGALVQVPDGHDVKTGLALAGERLGPGAGSEIQVLVAPSRGRADSGENRALVAALARRLEGERIVDRVLPPQLSRDGRKALVTAVPRAHFEHPEVLGLTDRLRQRPEAFAPRLAQTAQISAGGGAAQNLDFGAVTDNSLWKILVWALVFTFVILTVLLRSVVLPLKAVAMNLLTVGAAYGALVVVFQWGWLDWTPFFESSGHINSLTLPYLLAVVFGLSMDYEVFLLSRVRERWLATGDNRTAVADALRASAGTITSAAAIMVAVFMIFAFVSVPSVQEVGVGLAVAIALDATVVRLVLVPASMQLLGRWNWWMPGRARVPSAAAAKPT